MKKVGIIGGFGPDTTAEFTLSLIRMWKMKKPNSRPEILTWNSPIDERIEKIFIQKNRNKASFLELLLTGAKTLEKAGVDFLVLPCNSLHIFIEDIREKVKIPVLSIPEITTEFLLENNIKNVGILGSQVTIDSLLFKRILSRNHIKMIVPPKSDQNILNGIIVNLVTNKDIDKLKFETVVDNLMKKRPQKILLACTDLQLIKRRDMRILDTLELLEKATIKKMLDKD